MALRPEREPHPTGLPVDYLLPEGKSSVARYLLHCTNPGDPFLFESMRQHGVNVLREAIYQQAIFRRSTEA